MVCLPSLFPIEKLYEGWRPRGVICNVPFKMKIVFYPTSFVNETKYVLKKN